jgi:hypothetical protein
MKWLKLAFLVALIGLGVALLTNADDVRRVQEMHRM